MDPDLLHNEAAGDFFLALGAFNYAYTSLEHHLNCTVGAVVTDGMDGSKYHIANAVLGGMRMAVLKDTIKRLLRVVDAGEPTKKAIDTVFAHLGEIQFLRDRLAHHMTRQIDDAGQRWRNDDYASVRELDKSQVIEFEVSALTAATADIDAIKWFMDPLFDDILTINLEKFGLEPSKGFNPSELPSWQYKPSMLVRHRPRSSGRK